jgi:hypothetical protein
LHQECSTERTNQKEDIDFWLDEINPSSTEETNQKGKTKDPPSHHTKDNEKTNRDGGMKHRKIGHKKPIFETQNRSA